MKKIIESPFCDGKATLHKKIKKMAFRKEEFEVYDFYYKCENTGKEFSTSETGDITMRQLYNQYRENNNILFPEQISELRKKFGLTSLKMSNVLGFGPNIYKSYEKGDIPNKSNSTLLNVAKDPIEFFEIAKRSKQLTKFELDKLKEITDKLIAEESNFIIEKYFRINSDEINQFTGYTKRNFEKFANMVLFFIENGRTFTTRLNKYLFYSDFLCYKVSGICISGYTYCAIDMGPVPDDYKRLYGMMWDKGFIDNKEIEINGHIIERFVPEKDFNKMLFTKIELDIMKRVLKEFEFISTKDIINTSHTETAWLENKDGSKDISYQKYGFELKGI